MALKTLVIHFFLSIKKVDFSYRPIVVLLVQLVLSLIMQFFFFISFTIFDTFRFSIMFLGLFFARLYWDVLNLIFLLLVKVILLLNFVYISINIMKSNEKNGFYMLLLFSQVMVNNIFTIFIFQLLYVNYTTCSIFLLVEICY